MSKANSLAFMTHHAELAEMFRGSVKYNSGNINSVIARSSCDEAIQSFFWLLDCFVASLLAMTG